MYIRTTRSGGRSYLQLVEGFREDGVVRQRIVANLRLMREIGRVQLACCAQEMSPDEPHKERDVWHRLARLQESVQQRAQLLVDLIRVRLHRGRHLRRRTIPIGYLL